MLLYKPYWFYFGFGNAFAPAILGIYINGLSLYIFEYSKISIILLSLDIVLFGLSFATFLEKTAVFWIVWSILSGSFMGIITLFGYLRSYHSLSKGTRVVAKVANLLVWISFIVLLFGVRGILPIEICSFSLIIIIPSAYYVIGRIFYSIVKKIKENPMRKKNLQHSNLIRISYFTLVGFFISAIPCALFASIGAFLKDPLVFELCIITVSYIKIVLTVSNTAILVNKVLIYNIDKGRVGLSVFNTQHVFG